MERQYTDEEIDVMKAQAAMKASSDLPHNTFAAVPDEDIVDLQVSGQFGRVLNRVLEYLYQSEEERVVLASADGVKNEFKDMKQEDITLHAISVWAITNLLADFSMQAGMQNKTKIYDKEKIMTHIFGGVTSDDPLKPLTPEELKEYRDNEKKKVKDDLQAEKKEEATVKLDELPDDLTADERRDKRREHRDAQRGFDSEKDANPED